MGPYLVSAPPGADVLATDPSVWVVDGFVDRDDCGHIVSVASGRLDVAKVSRIGPSTPSGKRTGRVAWIPHDDDPVVRRLVDRLAWLVGIPAVHAESLQVVHYAPGQQYRPHFDAWEIDTDKGREKTATGGNRAVTALVYLNDVDEGGATVFPELRIDVAPVIGRLCVFDDLAPRSHDRHAGALHGGAEVLAGEKWACNLWFREAPYCAAPG
jgi:prolyl 4-hydroxylase